jgi:Zn finger protein HypA/HybF involved in hydrogenase expression
MSLVVFDYKCSWCPNYEADKLVSRKAMDDHMCAECGSPMVRVPAGTRTHFKFADTKLKKEPKHRR